MPSEMITVDWRRIGRIVRAFDIQPVEADEVVDRQRRELDDVDRDAGLFERLQRAGHLVALHREQADFRLERVAFVFAADERLVVPDHVFERERNLLPGFVLDDVGNLLPLDRRQLDEPRQAALAGHGDRHAVARHVVARDELLAALRGSARRDWLRAA